MTRTDVDFRGQWRIVETEGWDRDALDLVGPASITFGADGGGELRMIAIGADVDFRIAMRDGRSCVEFSWSGFDDGDPTCGRGFAERKGEDLVGRLFIHRGDESSFVAQRWSPADDRRPARRSSQRARKGARGQA